MGSDTFPTQYTPHRVKSVPPERWDLFHELVFTDELSRTGSGGLVWHLLGGFGIGCPPVLHYGSEELKQRILPGILNGDKRICLAITEPGMFIYTLQLQDTNNKQMVVLMSPTWAAKPRNPLMELIISLMVRRNGSPTVFGRTTSPPPSAPASQA